MSVIPATQEDGEFEASPSKVNESLSQKQNINKTAGRGWVAQYSIVHAKPWVCSNKKDKLEWKANDRL
jgi:hypothetical protein